MEFACIANNFYAQGYVEKQKYGIYLELPLNIPEDDRQVIKHACNVFAHLINKMMTFSEFARKIEKSYSITNNQTAEVVRILEKYS